MAQVDEAEKEASEVLHSLLSVERIEKVEVILEDDDPLQKPLTNPNSDTTGDESSNVWNSTLPTHSIFSIETTPHQFTDSQLTGEQVIWESAIPVTNGTEDMEDIYQASHAMEEDEEEDDEEEDPLLQMEHVSPIPQAATKSSLTKPKNTKSPKKASAAKPVKKKKKKLGNTPGSEATKLEESALQVKERFKRGCECQDESCFRGLNPESVYKHRLNIAELTKGEHDMYLMGVTMACLANPDTTVRHKERRRLRAQYVYQGRRVCLDAFLYLENCTHYQLKRIRKHVMTHGVAPRVHGNHGKKPHNTFPLDIYYHATEFLKQYLEQYTGDRDVVNTKQHIQLPWDVTRKNLHDAYKDYGQLMEPQMKLMGYSSFRHFMKEQFPHVKFCKVEPKSTVQNQTQTQCHQDMGGVQKSQERSREQIQKCVISSEVQQVIPLVVAQPNDNTGNQAHQQAFLVTPVAPILPNVSTNPTGDATTNTYSYQLTNAGYVVNDQGIVTTMANAQHTPYTFNRM